MDKKPSPPPDEKIWRTAIGRSDFAFRSMLYSAAGEFFLNFDHIASLVEQRKRTRFVAAISFFVAIAIAFVIILKSADISLDVQTPAGTIHNIPISNNVLLFVLSVATSYYVIHLINHILLNKQLYAIFEHTGLNQSEALSRAAHVSARWSAEELWIDVLNYRPVGFQSGLLHSLLILVSFLFLVAIALSQVTLIHFGAYAGLAEARSGDALSYYLVALPSAIAVHFAIFGFLVTLCVPMKFRWQPVPNAPLPPQTAQTDLPSEGQ
jgi:hypothetical protein